MKFRPSQRPPQKFRGLLLHLTGWTLAVCAVLTGIAPARAASGPDAVPGIAMGTGGRQRVVFSDGRTLDVLDVTIRAGRATLRTQEGHVIGFAANRILKVESIPEPPPAPPAPSATVPDSTPPAPEPFPAAVPVGPAEAPAAFVDAAASIDKEDESLESIIRDAAARYNLEVDLLAAVIAVESGYRPDAVSPKGAQGLMQLMPATAKDLAVVDPFDPRENVFAGARYLRELLDKNGDQYWRALAAYNAGSGRVARYDGLPPYKETIAYIRKVIDLYAKPKPIPLGTPIPR